MTASKLNSLRECFFILPPSATSIENFFEKSLQISESSNNISTHTPNRMQVSNFIFKFESLYTGMYVTIAILVAIVASTHILTTIAQYNAVVVICLPDSKKKNKYNIFVNVK